MLERSKLMTRGILAVLALAVAPACSKDNAVDATQNTTPGVGEQCSGEGDPACGTTGVCVLGYCRIGCATDGECAQGTLCIGDTPPFGCQLQQDIHCSTSQPCEAPLLCGLDNTCRIGCGVTDACPRNDQICIDGSCFGKLETNASLWLCDGSSQGDYRCDGTTMQVCDVGGLGWVTLASCETAALCAKGKPSGSCVDPACSSSGDHCEGSVMKVCNADRTEVVESGCDSAALCTAGLGAKSCKPKVCSASDLRCSAKSLQTCNADLDGWETLETCETTALCEDSVANAGGTCAPAACSPGDKRCTGANLEVCDVGRNGWALDSTCDTPELCTNGLAATGTCAAATCGVGEKHCTGTSVMACNAGRTGFEVEQVCPNVCSNGACAGDCPPTTQRCVGLNLQTCQNDGQWNTGIPCDYVCKNNYCTGSCAPNSTTCDGTKLRTCGPDGLWDAGAECAFACVNGACGGICKPGALQCGGGKVLYACQANGQWDTGTTCQYSCVNEACTAQCVPGTIVCEGDDQRACLPGGVYDIATKCPTGQRCYKDSCMPDPVPMPEGCDIDAMEVTRFRYAKWLATMPSTAGQDSRCSWNSDFTPSCFWPPSDDGEYPVVCVDWCDATAYCKGVGRRLCGRIGGGASGFDAFADPSSSQWYNACSSGGVSDYPYGDSYLPSACNVPGGGCPCETGAVMECPACQSPVPGYAGVFDMSGNVWEWEDSCVDGAPTSLCHLRGGSAAYPDPGGLGVRCDDGLADTRNGTSYFIGFRCCSDP